MEALPYYVPYEYVPFVAPDGKSAADYKELVHQAFLRIRSRVGAHLVEQIESELEVLEVVMVWCTKGGKEYIGESEATMNFLIF
ncbi:uncharacterized protein [Solanum lycopersicum]|uniref:uncharacterized protein isoform X2 n=1 Tax=Solanum lycopersicum TaxID=4081 RepID=UPI0037497F0E